MSARVCVWCGEVVDPAELLAPCGGHPFGLPNGSHTTAEQIAEAMKQTP